MPFLSWRLLKELLPLIYEVLMHLLEDDPSDSQRAELLARLSSYEGELLDHKGGTNVSEED